MRVGNGEFVSVKRERETFDEKGGELSPTPPKIDLRDAHAIRRELGAVYRDMRANRIPHQDGTRLAYVLDLMRRAWETADLLNRIEALEALETGKGGTYGKRQIKD